MSRSLSANVLAGIGGGSNPVYLLQVDSNEGTFYWSTQPFTDTEPTPDRVYTSSRLLKNGLGKVKNSIDLRSGGNVAQVNQFEFRLANGDLYSDTLATQFFENRRVELRLIFADKVDPFWSNAAPLFRGYVQGVPSWDAQQITFKCTGGWKKWGRKIPQRILDTTLFPLLVQENLRKPIPIIYGDWTEGYIGNATLEQVGGLNKSGIASNYSILGSNIRHRDYFRGYFLRPFGEGVMNFWAWDVFGSHDMKLIHIPYEDVEKFYYLADRKMWARLSVRHSGTYTFGEEYEGLFCQGAFLYLTPSQGQRVYCDLIPVVDETNTSGATNAAYASDEDALNYCTLDANGEVAAFETRSDNGEGDPPYGLHLKYYVAAVNRSDDKLQYRVLSDSGTVIDWTDVGGYGSLQDVALDGYLPINDSENGIYTGIKIQFKYVDVGGHDSGCEFRLYVVFLQITEKISEPPAVIYVSGKGRMFGSWIDDAGHSNSFNAGDLIENAAYVMESLLIDEAGAATSNLQLASFDSLATLRSSYKAARQLLEQRDLFDLLAEVCHEFAFACIEAPDGKFALRKIGATADAVTTYGRDTFLMKGQDTSFTIGRLDVKEIYNDFILRYKVNMATGEPEKMLFVRHPDEAGYEEEWTNLTSDREDTWEICATAYVNFQQVNLWEHTALWIRDDATAELFLKWIINRLTRRRHTVSFTAPLAALALELCDEAKFTHPLMPDAMDSVSRFRLIEQSIDPTTDTIDCTFLEVI